ncbi:MAG: OmpA family protein [Thermodesulfobacteriota bacterium]|nr:OmpA family protein [Thermodesulfobacteriota bacterium]
MKTDDLNKSSKTEKSGINSTPHEEWIELRKHLVGPEIKELSCLEERLDDPLTRATEVSRILPDAITLSVAKDNGISRALQPAIDQSVRISVTKNPQALAEAIFPALGPGIRKAIRATISAMFQSLNALLNQSFSIQGLKWRIEAFRTGTTFAEVVLFHTMVFQVEQIFLIHRKTGIVLQHVEVSGTQAKDPDLISGMLTAIQDFMNDSFEQKNGDEIETLRMGKDMSIWVEQGPQAIIAAVIRGRPPLELRQYYREMIDTVHRRYLKNLNEFNGDIVPFSVTKELLEDGLEQKISNKLNNRISPAFIIILLIIALASGIGAFTVFRQHIQFKRYVEKLKSEPGIVVLHADRKSRHYIITGLKDTLSRDERPMAREAGLNESKMVYQWEPYYALHPKLIKTRAVKWLKPPKTVDLILKDDTIAASGEASQSWIKHFCERAVLVPGINDYNISELKNTDLEKMDRTIQELSDIKIKFDSGKQVIDIQNHQLLQNAAEKIRILKNLSESLNIPLHVKICGFTDASGTEAQNSQISWTRAEKVLTYLTDYSINRENIVTEGKGIHPGAKPQDSEEASAIYRIVTFTATREEGIKK